jgi:fibronectin type 3 domain-containing protein
MRKPFLFVLICSTLMSSAPMWAQANACDLNGDGKVTSADVDVATSMALGTTACTANIVGSGVCNVVVVQRVVNAVSSGTCVTGTTPNHSVTLNWSASSGASGYNVYRGTTSGSYTKITSAAVTTTSYTDSSVQAGQTYYYVATAVNGTGESGYSNQASAAIPTP